ncbi:tetratricopeptide repeat protein [Rhodobacteraceae bacterium KN286]|uniref:Tetratricopeptide repeat protein n=2 Tax=Oceanomicrobium pacificus TaxID=2692916 RepID=A0A6B0THW8_9RHOB|nr:tetratricopeptide repeat protein [Oceanomicrobium pacificus]
MQADIRNDYANAADYYVRALARDPKNPMLLQNGLVTFIGRGDVDGAVALARRLREVEPENPIATLVMVADAFASEEYETALADVTREGIELNTLLAGLLKGWAEAGSGAFSDAAATFETLRQNDALAAFGQFNKALLLASAGDFEGAEDILARTPEAAAVVGRVGLVARAQILNQLDRTADAIALLDEGLANGLEDAVILDLRDRLMSGEDIAFDVLDDPRDGAAQAVLSIAAALGRENAERFALVYARLASHLNPELVEAQLLQAELLGLQGQFELASQAYLDVPRDSPLYLAAEIGRADALAADGQADAAIEALNRLTADFPDSFMAHTALADALRGEERFAEAAESYSDAIAQVENPTRGHWFLFYSRGISYERSDQWELAEADFRRALELFPDQPLVLNYLGYSLVELRRNLDEAQTMIEKAVAARPTDGYITDSLGWVLYRLGKYEEAVAPMERAVQLLPDDSVINDHLGDVLWMVDRKREARFQWRRALSFEPEEEEAERIRRKLEVGLDQVLEEEAGESTDTAANGG